MPLLKQTLFPYEIMNTTTNTEKINLKLRGMSCASCAGSIEEAISNVPGVESCNVNFGAEQAVIEYNPRRTSIEDIQQAVEEAGYSSYSLQEQEMITGEDDAEKAARKKESRDLIRKMIVGGIISIILIIGSLPNYGQYLPSFDYHRRSVNYRLSLCFRFSYSYLCYGWYG